MADSGSRERTDKFPLQRRYIKFIEIAFVTDNVTVLFSVLWVPYSSAADSLYQRTVTFVLIRVKKIPACLTRASQNLDKENRWFRQH